MSMTTALDAVTALSICTNSPVPMFVSRSADVLPAGPDGHGGVGAERPAHLHARGARHGLRAPRPIGHGVVCRERQRGLAGVPQRVERAREVSTAM